MIIAKGSYSTYGSRHNKWKKVKTLYKFYSIHKLQKKSNHVASYELFLTF